MNIITEVLWKMNRTRKEVENLNKALSRLVSQLDNTSKAAAKDGMHYTPHTLNTLSELMDGISGYARQMRDAIDNDEHLEKFGLSNMDAGFAGDVEWLIDYTYN